MDYINKKALMEHIEHEMHEWGDEYDASQILGDIEDFHTVNIQLCQNCGAHYPSMNMNYCPNCGKALV